MYFIKKKGKKDEPSRLDFAGKGKTRRKESEFKGVRMRKWGKWVSEIRVPGSRDRIWLGSYDTPERAARAYDAALYCLRGSHCRFNFPAEKRPEISSELSVSEIKAIAARFASPDSRRFGVFEEIVECDCSSSTFSTRTSSPENLFSGILENMPEIGDSLVGGLEYGGFSPGRFLVDDPVLPELDNFWEF